MKAPSDLGDPGMQSVLSELEQSSDLSELEGPSGLERVDPVIDRHKETRLMIRNVKPLSSGGEKCEEASSLVHDFEKLVIHDILRPSPGLHTMMVHQLGQSATSVHSDTVDNLNFIYEVLK